MHGDYTKHDILVCSDCLELLESRGYLRKDFHDGTSRLIFKNKFATIVNTERFEKIGGKDWKTIRVRLQNPFYGSKMLS